MGQFSAEYAELLKERQLAWLQVQQEARAWSESLGLPLEIDIGCGSGDFLVGLAARYPGHAFVGIDRMLGRCRTTQAKIERLGLSNARVWRADCLWAVQALFLPGSVTTIHVSFPDPWPKRKHKHHRLLNQDFFAAAYATLKPGGQLRLMTDSEAYFTEFAETVQQFGRFVRLDWEDGRLYPSTEFQRFFESSGLPTHRLALGKH